MRVLHVTFSASGGAGAAAGAIVEAQKEVGLDASLFSVSPVSISENPLSHPLITSLALVDHLSSQTDMKTIFSGLRAHAGVFSRTDLAKAEVINLHWTPGALSLGAILQLTEMQIPLVWTLHDMFPFTGGCHFSLGCAGYEIDCAGCPQLKPSFQGNALSQLRLKVQIAQQGMHFVSPSMSLLDRFLKSAVGRSSEATFIPNPIIQSSMGLFQSRKPGNYIVFMAADVQDKRKGLEEVLRWWALAKLRKVTLVVIGKGSSRLTNTEKRIVGLGFLSRKAVFDQLMSAQALVVASQDDNSPNVIAEAHSLGVPVFVPPGLQIGDWLKRDGVSTVSELELVRGLAGIDALKLREQMGAYIAARQLGAVGEKYAELYLRLANQRVRHAK